MSPLKRPVMLDNDVVTRLYSAGVLHRSLQVRLKSNFRVTEQVAEEAKQWRTEGQRLAKLLRELEAAGILIFVSVDESSEVEIWVYSPCFLWLV